MRLAFFFLRLAKSEKQVANFEMQVAFFMLAELAVLTMLVR